MKTKILTLVAIIATSISFTSCSDKYIYSHGILHPVYIDYEEIKRNGIEVTEDDAPKNAEIIGRLSYVVRFERGSEAVKQKLDPNTDDMIVPISKYKKIGSLEEDIKKLPQYIVHEIQKRKGKGIAKIDVSVTHFEDNPIFHIRGVIYR